MVTLENRNVKSSIKDKIMKIAKKNKNLVSAMLVGATVAYGNFAYATEPVTGSNTGNSDLDTLIGQMETGLDSIKTGGLYIIGAVLVVAVAFLGGRWLWNLFRSWLSRAA